MHRAGFIAELEKIVDGAHPEGQGAGWREIVGDSGLAWVYVGATK